MSGPRGLPEVLAVLEDSRRLGFLGPGPVADHIELALAMAAAVPDPPAMALDLGSGGGVPGLVLAMVWPASNWALLDSKAIRTEFLAAAAQRLNLKERVRVVRARAEDAGRDPKLRARHDLVVSRGFGPPAVTAECGSPFLRLGGRLVVTEPPESPAERWPEEPLSVLGLEVVARRQVDDPLASGPGAWIALVQSSLCPDRFPRRTGLPSKRPLFPALRND